jgi:hypothetical protein
MKSGRLRVGPGRNECEATRSTAPPAAVLARGFPAVGFQSFPQICRKPDSTPLRRRRIHWLPNRCKDANDGLVVGCKLPLNALELAREGLVRF